MKYFDSLTKLTKEQIQKSLPDRFSSMDDDWSCNPTHCIGISAVFSSSYLMSERHWPSLLLAETRLGATQQTNLIEDTLLLSQKLKENMVAIVCDNCELNKAITSQLNKTIIRCAFHQSFLAVNDYIIYQKSTHL